MIFACVVILKLRSRNMFFLLSVKVEVSFENAVKIGVLNRISYAVAREWK